MTILILINYIKGLIIAVIGLSYTVCVSRNKCIIVLVIWTLKSRVTSLHILRHMGKTSFEIEKVQSFHKQSIKHKYSIAVPSEALAVAQTTEVLWSWPSLLTNSHCFFIIPLCSSPFVAFEKQAVDSNMWWDLRLKFSFWCISLGRAVC